MEGRSEPQFASFLQSQGIHSFDQLWSCSMERVEEGNQQASGAQSEVFRWHHVFVKKQAGYTTRLSRWFIPQAVCAREYDNILIWNRLGLPTLEALYFYQESRARRAILITRALEGYQPLDQWLEGCKDLQLRAKVFNQVAKTLAQIHRLGWYHRCFYPKHVFVKLENPEALKIIDLEKARKQFRTTTRDISEIASFFRRCHWLNPKEGLQFMKAYWGVNKFEDKHRLFLKRMENKILSKKS